MSNVPVTVKFPEGRSSTLRLCSTLDLIFLNNFGTNRQDPIYMQLDALHIHWSLWKDIDLDFNGPQFSCLACQSHSTAEYEILVLKLLCFETFVQILGIVTHCSTTDKSVDIWPAVRVS